MNPASSITPYCGMPAVPSELWQRWNLDPILLVILFGALIAYLHAARSRKRASLPLDRTSVAWFIAGWLVATAALVSPLCALSVALFSARVGQHMILALASAPLVLLGRPGEVFAGYSASTAAWLAGTRLMKFCTSATGAAGLFALLLWLWHAPGPYDATFVSSPLYWLMHVSLYSGALLVWSVLLDRSSDRVLPVLGVGAFTTLQMTLLGALITITPHALYWPHFAATSPWGLTSIADQQLGGLIMWVPACTVFLGVTVLTLVRAMRLSDHPPQFRSA